MGFNHCHRFCQSVDSNGDMSSLHIDSVTKSYHNKVVLSDVFLSCQKGEVKGLVGRNGSGKSTLLKIVFGTEKADYKFVQIGKKVIRTVGDGRNLVNYLPQDHFLPNNISIGTLIKLFLPRETRATVSENEYVRPLLHKRNQDLSGGERRIIEILLIIHSNAAFILLDEPFNGLSPVMRDYVMEYIRNLKASKGFIITDHDYENVLQLADSIFFLQDGYLREIRDKQELVDLGYMTRTAYNDVYK